MALFSASRLQQLDIILVRIANASSYAIGSIAKQTSVNSYD